MKFRYRLNFYKDEDGEYTEPLDTNFLAVKKVIQQNWPNDGHLEDLRIIHISDQKERQIILRNCGKGVFEIFYLNSNKRYHFHKKSRVELIYESVEFFMNSDYLSLSKSLNKTKKDRSYLRNGLLGNHNYALTKERNWKELKWFFTLGIPYILLFGFIEIFIFNAGSSIWFLPIIFVIGLLFWLPGLFLHWQYYKDNKNLKVTVTKGNQEITIEYNEFNKKFKKSDINVVLKNTILHETLNMAIGGRFPWIFYGYTEIAFKTGEVVNLTNLMVDQLFVLEKFRNDNIKRGIAQRAFPTLKRKTYIAPKN